MKVIDKINDYRERGELFFSFEFFPPKTEAGLHNLYARLDRMAALEPAYIDITWGTGGSTSELTLEISRKAQEFFGLEVMTHMTCTEMSRSDIRQALLQAKDAGVTNLLALRGDPPQGARVWEPCANGFAYASDLTKFIRDEHGDYFGIGVAGYPEGHLEADCKESCVRFLKQKVEAGADFVVTQLFYDVEEFLRFLERCRRIGIECPIIPGLLPIQTYDRFRRFVDFCRIKVPDEVERQLEFIKNDDAAVHAFGVELAIKMCERLRKEGVPGFHFYTLNLESSVTSVLKGLGLVDDGESRRALPWRPSAHPNREKEDVRPIFWSNRPKSYLARTMDWDDFPNGRWGDSRSPTFGDLSDYYMLRQGIGLLEKKERRREMWGAPRSMDDVRAIFADFCQGRIDRLPWCEVPVQRETGLIVDPLVRLNRYGYLTINSQPQVNGAPSNDPYVGWGGPDGVVFQKAYVEFFVSRRELDILLRHIETHPSLTFQAVNVKGKCFTNLPDRSVNAVTWGVFPGKEIIQPTVVDSEVFMVWKDEAFALWLEEWASLYETGDGSRKLIEDIHDNFYLVNVVENDFIKGNIFAVFEHCMEELDALAVKNVTWS